MTFPGCKLSLDKIARQAKLYFNGVIIYPKHIHVDIRNKPYFGKGKY